MMTIKEELEKFTPMEMELLTLVKRLAVSEYLRGIRITPILHGKMEDHGLLQDSLRKIVERYTKKA